MAEGNYGRRRKEEEGKKRKRGKFRKEEARKEGRKEGRIEEATTATAITPVVPALGRLRQKGCHEFEARLGYTVRIPNHPGL